MGKRGGWIRSDHYASLYPAHGWLLLMVGWRKEVEKRAELDKPVNRLCSLFVASLLCGV